MATLKTAKDQLVQSEKLAALGALVAGVAHELNTPIGNGLTVASSLQFRVEELATLLDKGMKRSDLSEFLEDTRMATDILTRNLARAGALVASFKQVAVDQTSSQRRRFLLSDLVSEILLTLNPTIRSAGCHMQVDVADTLQMDSFPGPLGQVLNNLINNAIVHGFQQQANGTISIDALGSRRRLRHPRGRHGARFRAFFHHPHGAWRFRLGPAHRAQPGHGSIGRND